MEQSFPQVLFICQNELLTYCFLYSFVPQGVDSFHIEIYDERAFLEDEKIAWALIEIPEEVFAGQTREEWVDLNGKQGDGKEGQICVVMSFTVSIIVMRIVPS